MKTPAFKVTTNSWNNIKAIIESFGYDLTMVDKEIPEEFSFIVLDLNGIPGVCSNLSIDAIYRSDRYIIATETEFLTKAAEFLGKKFDPDNIQVLEFTFDSIKPGMVVEYRDGSRALVIPQTHNLYFVNDNTCEGDYMYKNFNHVVNFEHDIVAVYKIQDVGTLKDIFNDQNLELVWNK